MRAHADVVVLRSELGVPGRKAAIRQELIKGLGSLGRVEHIERFLMDPPDGPYRDGEFADVDWDTHALIRAIGQVTPSPIAKAGGQRPQ